MHRRKYLTTIATMPVIAVAGCTGDDSNGNGDSSTDPSERSVSELILPRQKLPGDGWEIAAEMAEGGFGLGTSIETTQNVYSWQEAEQDESIPRFLIISAVAEPDNPQEIIIQQRERHETERDSTPEVGYKEVEDINFGSDGFTSYREEYEEDDRYDAATMFRKNGLIGILYINVYGRPVDEHPFDLSIEQSQELGRIMYQQW